MKESVVTGFLIVAASISPKGYKTGAGGRSETQTTGT